MNQQSLGRLMAVIFTLFMFSTLILQSASTLDEAYDNLKNNNFSKAKELFQKETKIPENAEEAYVMLIFISDYQFNERECLGYLKELLKITKNPNEIYKSLENTDGLFQSSYHIEYDVIEMLENFLDNKLLTEDTKVQIKDYLIRKYDYRNDFRKLQKVKASMGAVTDWSFLGTFENISQSGFDKNFGALEHPETSFNFKNRYRAEIKWIPTQKPHLSNWLYFSHYFAVENSISYAQSFCLSPADTIGQIRIGTSGSLKLWVNDKLYLSIPEERNNGIDTYISTVKLNKGYNRILLQVGSSEINDANFLLRITDFNGVGLKNLEYSTEYKDYQKESAFIPQIVESKYEQYFKEKIKQNPDKLYNYMMLASIYIMTDKNFETKVLLNEALKLAPKCNLILYQILQAYYRTKDNTKHSKTIEQIIQNEPESIFAYKKIFAEELENNNFVQAKNILDKLFYLSGDKLDFYQKQIALLFQEKKYEEIYNIVKKAYQEYPNEPQFIILNAKILNNLSNEVSTYRKYLDMYNNSSIREQLVKILVDSKNYNELIYLLEYEIERNPTDFDKYVDLGDLYFNDNSYELALENYQFVNKVAPYYSYVYHKTANTYKMLKETEKAKDAYKTCLKYNPYNFVVREKLRSIENKKEVFDYFQNVDYYALYKNAPKETDYPGQSAVILKDDACDVLYKDGVYESKVVLQAKILNSKGIDLFKEYNIGHYSNEELIIEKAEVLKKDGSKLKAEVNENNVVFTNLSEGDGVLLIYKKQTYQNSSLSNYFNRKWIFNSFLPVQSSSYFLLAEKGVQFQSKISNSNCEAKISDLGDYTLHEWIRHDMPAMKQETASPNMGDFAESITVSTFPKWDMVSKWYYGVANTKSKSDIETKETVKNLFPKDHNYSKLEIAKRIYTYIVKNIRYSSNSFRQSGFVPQKASKVINSLIGDCKDVSTLFVSLCKEMGLDASLVLVSTRDNGKFALNLPSIDFNHCIATITIDNKKYFVELTSDKVSFGTIGGSIYDAFALEINEKDSNEPFYIKPMSSQTNFISRNSKINFEGDKIKKFVITKRSGNPASNSRNTFQNKSKELQQQAFVKSIIDQYSDVKLLNYEFDSSLDDVLKDTVIYNYSFETSKIFSKIADLTTFTVPLTDYYTSFEFLSYEKRESPLDIHYLAEDTYANETVEFEIPTGLILAEVPKDAQYSSDYADYSISFKQSGRNFKIFRQFTWKKDYLLPNEYLLLKDFLDKVIVSDKTQLAFRPEPVATPKKGKK